MKITTEICLRKFRVRRSLQKNGTKNKKRNDKKKKEKKNEKKKNKSKKNVKGKEKNTFKGEKNKNLKNKPKAENSSKKCKLKKSKSSKKARSKRADQDQDQIPISCQDPCQDLHWRDPKQNTVIEKHKKISSEFNAVLEDITNCFLTPDTANNRFFINSFT